MDGELTRLEAAIIHDGSYLVTVSGPVEGPGSKRLRDTLVPLAAGGDARVILDLTRAGHLDREAVGSLAAAAEIARTAGGELWLVGARRPVLDLFASWGVDHLFVRAATMREAMAAFA